MAKPVNEAESAKVHGLDQTLEPENLPGTMSILRRRDKNSEIERTESSLSR